MTQRSGAWPDHSARGSRPGAARGSARAPRRAAAGSPRPRRGGRASISALTGSTSASGIRRRSFIASSSYSWATTCMSEASAADRRDATDAKPAAVHSRATASARPARPWTGSGSPIPARCSGAPGSAPRHRPPSPPAGGPPRGRRVHAGRHVRSWRPLRWAFGVACRTPDSSPGRRCVRPAASSPGRAPFAAVRRPPSRAPRWRCACAASASPALPHPGTGPCVRGARPGEGPVARRAVRVPPGQGWPAAVSSQPPCRWWARRRAGPRSR